MRNIGGNEPYYKYDAEAKMATMHNYCIAFFSIFFHISKQILPSLLWTLLPTA
jgi:hypothetical protein